MADLGSIFAGAVGGVGKGIETVGNRIHAEEKAKTEHLKKMSLLEYADRMQRSRTTDSEGRAEARYNTRLTEQRGYDEGIAAKKTTKGTRLDDKTNNTYTGNYTSEGLLIGKERLTGKSTPDIAKMGEVEKKMLDMWSEEDATVGKLMQKAAIARNGGTDKDGYEIAPNPALADSLEEQAENQKKGWNDKFGKYGWFQNASGATRKNKAFEERLALLQQNYPKETPAFLKGIMGLVGKDGSISQANKKKMVAHYAANKANPDANLAKELTIFKKEFPELYLDIAEAASETKPDVPQGRGKTKNEWLLEQWVKTNNQPHGYSGTLRQLREAVKSEGSGVERKSSWSPAPPPQDDDQVGFGQGLLR